MVNPDPDHKASVTLEPPPPKKHHMRRGRISDEGRAQSQPAILSDLGRSAMDSGNVRGGEQADTGLRTHLTPGKRD